MIFRPVREPVERLLKSHLLSALMKQLNWWTDLPVVLRLKFLLKSDKNSVDLRRRPACDFACIVSFKCINIYLSDKHVEQKLYSKMDHFV